MEPVTSLFDLKYGVAGVCVLLTIQVLLKVADFILKQSKSEKLKETAANQLAILNLTNSVKTLTDAVDECSETLEKHAEALAAFPKFRTDVRRFYAAIKELSGDRWPAIREEILKDEFTL